MKNKAVILGANYYIGLSIIRNLGKNGIYTVAVDYDENTAYALKSRYLDEKIIAPNYKTHKKEYLKVLIDYAKAEEVKPVLFPTADPYVEFIEENFDILKKYYLFNMDEKGLFTKVMNKDTLAVLAKKFDVKIPETISPKEKNFYKRVEAEIGFPCLVKPADSSSFVDAFRVKLFKVYNIDELKEKLKLSKENNLEVIVQRMIPGFDDHMYTFDAYLNKDSKITHFTTCQKYRQFPINFGASVYTTQKYVKELYEIGKRFFEGIKWKGFAEIEFKKDEITGEYYLIEVNVRTTNFNELLTKVGLNMPLIAYFELTGKPLPDKAVNYDTGYVFWYAYEDFAAVRAYIKTKQLTIFQVFKSYFKKKVHSTWSLKDPMPYIAFLNMKAKKFIKRVIK